MSEPCDCDWCGKCREQYEHQRRMEDMRGYGIPAYNEDEGDEE
jgi:hypothetical protein